MKKILALLIVTLAGHVFADGPVYQISPFMQPVLQAQNSTAAQTALDFTGNTTLNVITNTAQGALGPATLSLSNQVGSLQFTPLNMLPPYAWKTNGWVWDWWRPIFSQPASSTTISSYAGINGHTLTGTAVYDPFAMAGYPGIIQPTAGNYLGNANLLPTYFTNSGTFAIAFCWTKPGALPSGQAIANCSYNGNALYWNLSPTSQSASGDLLLTDGGIGPGGGTGNQINLDSSSLNNVHVFLATWTNGVYQDYIDGTLIGNISGGAFYPPSNVWLPGFLGGFYLGNNYAQNWTFAGAEGEFLMSTNYAYPATADEIQTLFLNDYGKLRKRFEIIGDSIVNGGLASLGGDLDSYLDPFLAGWNVVNASISGATTFGLLTNQIISSRGASAGSFCVKAVYSNLNNDGTGNASQVGGFLATITNNLTTMATNISACGDVPLLVVPPSNPYTDTNGERALFINWATNCALNYFSPPLIRLDLLPCGTNGAWQNTTWFPITGNPHGTNAFYQMIAPAFPSALHVQSSGTNFYSTMNFAQGQSLGPNQAIAWQNPQATFIVGGVQAGVVNTAVGDAFYGAYCGPASTLARNVYGVGQYVLLNETNGNATDEEAFGAGALQSVNGGFYNAVLGDNAANAEISANSLALVGHSSFANVTNLANTAAIGRDTGWGVIGQSDGTYSFYAGYRAGFNVTNDNDNIEIGSQGQAGDGQTTRIGTTQTNCVIAGRLTDASGFASSASGTMLFSAGGCTNNSLLNWTIYQMTGTGFIITNVASHWGSPASTITTPGETVILQPGDEIIGSSCIENTNRPF